MSGSRPYGMDGLREDTKKLESRLKDSDMQLKQSTSKFFKGIDGLNQHADQSYNRVNSKLDGLQAKLDKLKEEKRQEEAAKQSSSTNSGSQITPK